MMYNISKQLRSLMASRNLTAAILAKRMGLQTDKIYSCRKDNYPVIPRTVEQFAAAFDMTPSEFLGYEFTPAPVRKPMEQQTKPNATKERIWDEKAVLRMLENFGGRPYYENPALACHAVNTPVKGAKRLGAHGTTEMTSTGGGQG